jgi:ankyrin repeat protein
MFVYYKDDGNRNRSHREILHKKALFTMVRLSISDFQNPMPGLSLGSVRSVTSFQFLLEKVKALSDGFCSLKAEPPLNQRAITPQKPTPLQLALENSDLAAVRHLIEQGANPNEATQAGVTPTHVAAYFEDLDTLELLVLKGADLNFRSFHGFSPLMIAAIIGQDKALKFLVAHGADLELSAHNGRTPLIAAIIREHTHTVQCLIDLGADPNHAEEEGFTALHYAAGMGHLELVKCLAAQGADLSKVDRDGITPLFMAVVDGHAETVQYLIDQGVVIHFSDPQGYHPLIRALKLKPKNWQQISRLIIDKDPKALNLAKEIIHRKYVAHVVHVRGTTHIPAYGVVNLEGFVSRYFRRKIAKSLLALAREMPDILPLARSQLIASAYSAIEDDPQAILQRWLAGNPVIIESGCNGHGIAVLIWENCLILCDRGGVLLSRSYAAYRFDPACLNAQLIEKLQKQYGEKRGFAKKFFNITLPKKLHCAQTLFEKKLQEVHIANQGAGNCAWASQSGILLPLLILQQYHVPGKPFTPKLEAADLFGNRQKLFERVASKQQALYAQWESFQQALAIRKNVECGPNRPYPPDFELLSKALCKSIPSVRVDQRIQAKWAELNQTFLQMAPKYTQMKHRLRLYSS